MSLKAFHIFFIGLSIIFTLGFGVWGVRDYSVSGKLDHLSLGVFSAVCGILLIRYLAGFLAKIKTMGKSL